MRGRVLKSISNKYFRTEIGCVDAKDISSVYVRLTTWTNIPIDTNITSTKIDRLIRKELIDDLVFDSERTIIDTNYAINKTIGKRTFLDIELNLYQLGIGIDDFTDTNLQWYINEFISIIINTLQDKLTDWTFHLSSKD